ncbi:MAG TPA: hypothetical protein VJZ06_00645 [Mobilitalea sp.]|nr:hypothetical protein [Mobilitalea sp.]
MTYFSFDVDEQNANGIREDGKLVNIVYSKKKIYAANAKKRPHKLCGRPSAPYFRYLTCLLDKGHINIKPVAFLFFETAHSYIIMP